MTVTLVSVAPQPKRELYDEKTDLGCNGADQPVGRHRLCQPVRQAWFRHRSGRWSPLTDVGTGPEGMTVKAADEKTLKDYLQAIKQ